MPRVILLIAIFIGIPLEACGANLPLQGDDRENFLQYPFQFVIGVSKKEVEERLGPAKEYKRTVRRNPHVEGTFDVFHDFIYDGLRITLGAFPAADPPRIDLIEVQVDSGKYRLKYGIVVGSSRGRVQAVLGKPDYSPDSATWDFDGTGQDVLRFRFQNDRVIKIEWSREYD